MEEIKPLFLTLALWLSLTFLPLGNIANAANMQIDDLLSPEFPSTKENAEGNQQLVGKPIEEINGDDFLGPKDIFPFLPDNHRDSGTGKFNSF